MYGRNQFRNPATGETYNWPINHSTESSQAKTRNLASGANTGRTGLVVQQGEDTPLILELQGTILTQAQRNAMSRWFQLSRDQSIIFRDFTGAESYVLITSFDTVRKSTLFNPRDPACRLHYWTYTIRMQVLTVISGDWAGVTP